MGDQRTILVGVDGISRLVLERVVEAGDLPSLAALLERGATATLAGTVPSSHAASWASLATGTGPAEHGVFGPAALRPDGSTGAAGQRDLRARLYYEQLGREGLSSVVAGLPFAHAGCESAVLVNCDADGASPILPLGRRERYARLLAACGDDRRRPASVDDLCRRQRACFDLGRELFLRERWDHFLVRFASVGCLAEAAGGALLRRDRAALDAFRRLFRQLDEQIGWFRARAPEATVVLAAPSGVAPARAVLDVAAFLRGQGLAAEPEAGDDDGWLKALFRRASAAAATADREATLSARNGAIYAAADADLDALREALLALRLDDGGVAVDDAWPARGDRRDGEPALLFVLADGVRVGSSPDGAAVAPAGGSPGALDRHGFLALAGPHVAAGDLGVASVCDVAPTLLWAAGAGIPRSMEGRVLAEAFDADFVSSRSIRDSHDDEAVVRETEPRARLRALGYL